MHCDIIDSKLKHGDLGKRLDWIDSCLSCVLGLISICVFVLDHIRILQYSTFEIFRTKPPKNIFVIIHFALLFILGNH